MRVVFPELSKPMTRIFASFFLKPRALDIRSNNPIVIVIKTLQLTVFPLLEYIYQNFPTATVHDLTRTGVVYAWPPPPPGGRNTSTVHVVTRSEPITDDWSRGTARYCGVRDVINNGMVDCYVTMILLLYSHWYIGKGK